MSNKPTGIIPIAIIGFLIVGLTLAIFFIVGFERTTINLLALMFLMISEFALFSGLIATRVLGAKFEKVSMTVGVTITLIAYFFVTLITVFTAGLFEENIGGFVLLEIVIIIITAILLVIFFAVSGSAAKEGQRIVAARSFMDGCEKRMYALMSANKNTLYDGSFKSIYEGIKYSDKIGASSVDLKIDDAITRLETSFESDKQDKKEISGVFDEITALLNRRKAEVSESKRGGF